MMARGGGVKNKTALHAAAEHCHAAVVEYIVDVTRGRLNLEVDGLGIATLKKKKSPFISHTERPFLLLVRCFRITLCVCLRPYGSGVLFGQIMQVTGGSRRSQRRTASALGGKTWSFGGGDITGGTLWVQS